MARVNPLPLAAALACTCLAAPCALAQVSILQGNAATEALWRTLVGGEIPLEDFESYRGVPTPFSGPSDIIQSLPSLHVDLYADAPEAYPGIYTDLTFAHSGANQLCNFGGGIAQYGDFYIVPSPGYTIRALGFWQCDPQDNQTLFLYDADNRVVGSVTALINNGSGNSFAAFISDIPIVKIRVEGSLGDGFNHIDDLQIVVNASTPTCRLDYNQDGSLNPDDIGDYITDYFTFPPVPGPGGYAILCPDNDPPYDQGYKAGYTSDASGQCGEPNPDNLGDWITDYFASPGC